MAGRSPQVRGRWRAPKQWVQAVLPALPRAASRQTGGAARSPPPHAPSAPAAPAAPCACTGARPERAQRAPPRPSAAQGQSQPGRTWSRRRVNKDTRRCPGTARRREESACRWPVQALALPSRGGTSLHLTWRARGPRQGPLAGLTRCSWREVQSSDWIMACPTKLRTEPQPCCTSRALAALPLGPEPDTEEGWG